MSASIHALPSADLPDMAVMLRKLADAIDAGEYGEVLETALVMNGDRFDVFGFGRADSLVTHYLLGCGMARMQQPMTERP